uniref:polysaccharide deacetylase family protein n=1 Tax=Carnobacterium TaxID=2747 RepID=UPI00344FF40E
MIKRIKLPGWILIVLLLLITFFGIKKISAKQAVEPIDSNNKSVASGIYPGLNLKTTTKETSLYTVSISQPYTETKAINKKIDKWINQQKKEFTADTAESKNMLEDNDFRAHLNIQVQTNQLADKLYSLELEAYQISGGANGLTRMKPFIIDLNRNKVLTIKDIFQLDSDNIQTIKKIISKEIQSDKEVGSYVFDDYSDKALENPEKWNVSVSSENVTFYFDQYEIAAGAAGAIKAEIPIKKMEPFLNKKFIKKIDIKIKKEEKANTEDEDIKEPAAVVKKLDPNGKYVALTFDDGPNPDVTPRILETLEQHKALATFFMLGSQVEYYPSLAGHVMTKGHEIGNHTMNHQDLTTLGIEQVRKEIQQSSAVIEQATGNLPTLLRPPYGAINENVKQLSTSMNLPIIMWSVDSLDWKTRNKNAVIQEVMSHVTSGSIVLLHDIHASTADALPQLLDTLEKQGYQMVTVSQLLDLWDEKDNGPYFGKIG